ncbi:MAG: fibronectin type III domain-containing protein [Minisyncoccota bacterium]
MTNLSKIKKIVSPFSVILYSIGLIALLYLIAQAATSYQVNSGATVTVDEWSACKKVTNNNSLALFVPTNTELEWTTFKTNAPNIVLSDCISAPLAPASLAANPGDTQASLVWTVPSSDGGSAITSYKVYRGTTSGGEVLVTSGGCSSLGNVLTCTDTGLTNAIPYYYKVSAVNAIGEGSLSAEATVYPGSKRIFITSTTYTGNLTGLAGADAKCQARADAVSLGGTWKAWISSGATDITSATDRLTHSSSLYVNMIGIKVADNWDDLVDGSLDAAIQYNENRASYSGQVWTGSNYNGTNYFSQDCSGTGAGWTVTTGTGEDAGLSGIASSVTGSWSNNGANSCNTSLPLYCFEQ